MVREFIEYLGFLQPYHCEILLESNFIHDRAAVFEQPSHLHPQVIETGLNSPHERIRELAYHHPSCTDEQRVTHHLKFGIL